MKILVTGSKGFIGKALCARLKKEGHNVIEYTRNICNIIYIHKESQLFKDVDVIFHLASTVDNYNILDNPFRDAETNILGTISVLEGMKQFCPLAKLIYTSTWFGLEGKSKGTYGATKFCAESYCKVYSEVFGLNVNVAILGNVYGVGDYTDNNKKSALVNIIYKAIKNETINLYDENTIRKYTYIDDVITCLCAIAEEDSSEKFKSYTITKEEPNSMYEIITILLSIVGSGKVKIVETPDFHKKVGLKSCNIHQNLPNSVKNMVFTSVEKGVKKTVEWIKNGKH